MFIWVKNNTEAVVVMPERQLGPHEIYSNAPVYCFLCAVTRKQLVAHVNGYCPNCKREDSSKAAMTHAELEEYLSTLHKGATHKQSELTQQIQAARAEIVKLVDLKRCYKRLLTDLAKAAKE